MQFFTSIKLVVHVLACVCVWSHTSNGKDWDTILLHKCTINEDHMMHDFWNKKHDRQKFLSFWVIFCPFTPLTTQKIKILKNWRKHLATLSFPTRAPYMTTIWYIVPEIWSATDPLMNQKIKIFSKCKTHLYILWFYKCVP